MTGRVSRTGEKVGIDRLCEWFRDLAGELDSPTVAAPFMESFAQPQSIQQIGVALIPRALQFDPGIIQERLDLGWVLEADGSQLNLTEINLLLEKFAAVWTLVPQADAVDPGAPSVKWMIEDSGQELGTLVRRETKLSMNSSYLARIQVIDPAGQRSSLKSWFTQGEVPFVVSFDNPAYLYYLGRLFKDQRLVQVSKNLVEILKAELPQNTVGEKVNNGKLFDPMSLFGFTEQRASTDDYIVCDDIGKEWADYISVSSPSRTINFYHCKSTEATVGAAGLHEVVAQALKNLGYLTAEPADLNSRRQRWAGTWGTTTISRLRKGESVDQFVTEFSGIVSSPNFISRVILVVSSLSKASVEAAFERLRDGDPAEPHVNQLLWLLSFFVDGCRMVGAVPEIICEP